jgi:hypothetical protein
MKLRNRPFVFCIGIVIILFASTSALAAVNLNFYTGKSFLVHVKQKGFCALDESLTTVLDKNNDIENVYIKIGSWAYPDLNATYYFEDDGFWYSVPFTLKYKFGTAEDAVLETAPAFTYNSDYSPNNPDNPSCELTTIYLGIRLTSKFENGIQSGKISHVAGVGKDKECIVEITILSSKMVETSSLPDADEILSCTPNP